MKPIQFMKPVQYRVPVPKDRTVFIQEDFLDKFYPHMHCHEEYQLIWIKEGAGQLLVDDNVHYFEKNDIFLLGSNQAHVFKNDLMYGCVQSISIFFSLKGALSKILNVPELSMLLDFIDKNGRGFKVPELYLPQVSRRIEALKNSDSLGQLVSFFYLLKSLNKLSFKLKPLSGMISHGFGEVGSFRITTLCNFLENNYKENIGLNEMAEKANLTPQAFCRYFKKSTGKTFVSYLNELRVREACRLLGGKDYDCISIVAYDSGFNSITNFNRVFRSILGISPKMYVANYKNLLYE
ncbi:MULTISPECIES: AraC family transcriptional regulator [Sphingobacterium]|uniref:AraC family transcriptional regulator n=1 Tax=Sphingobacterium kitahiroshimense TaxID=470446 RepID=A0ABV0BT83_9SPHI|nr:MULTISPECIES: AraC family transcriptional regulator [Sphingobacterium]MCW2262173.1 AraC-like DNA-binding protein [Sphingobacterium kitahiroshimense]TCR13080.1 AraC-like DNA-binding protein [Sphingobacterium sp. JUb78]